VLEVAEGEQRPLDQLVVGAAVEPGEARQPAGGMCEAWVVQAHASRVAAIEPIESLFCCERII